MEQAQLEADAAPLTVDNGPGSQYKTAGMLLYSTVPSVPNSDERYTSRSGSEHPAILRIRQEIKDALAEAEAERAIPVEDLPQLAAWQDPHRDKR